MGDGTGIEWADATWNPLVGCTSVSPGCDNCYARTLVDTRMHPASQAKAAALADGDVAPTEVSEWTERYYAHLAAQPFPEPFDVVHLRPTDGRIFTEPLRWTRPRKVFVNSLSDLFHKDVPEDFIARVFAVMALTPQHTYQLLTKRHGRMRALLSDVAFRARVLHERARLVGTRFKADPWWRGRTPDDWWPLPNLWLGVSVEDQARADLRIPALLGTPAAVRWLSMEPLLGPVDIARALAGVCWHCGGTQVLPGSNSSSAQKSGPPACWHCRDGRSAALDWVVVGGESGRGDGVRPMHPGWARSLRDQCAAASVPFLFKQAGSVLAREWGAKGKGGDPSEWPEQFPREYPDA